MTSDVTRDEFDLLHARVEIAEREIEGEKMVTRHILEQTRHNGDDLAAVKTRLDRVEGKVDGLDRKVDSLGRKAEGLDRRFDGVESTVGSLAAKLDDMTRSLPEIIGETVREAFREQFKK